MVLLRHELPDGSWHYDWMMARRPIEDPRGAGPLLTFRVSERPDEVSVRSLAARRLGDHREAYLAYEGELSGGRGRVSRVATGEARVTERGDGSLMIESRFARGVRCWIARMETGAGEPDRWRIEAAEGGGVPSSGET